MMPVLRILCRRGGLAVVLACTAAGTSAQALRDPTVAPAATGVGGASAADAAREKPVLDLMRGADGRYRVLHDGRFLQAGQRLGTARITRITETEVWLQTDGDTQKWARYPAVTVRRAAPPGSTSAPVPPSTPQTRRTAP